MNCTLADVAVPLSGTTLGGLGAYDACVHMQGFKYCLAGYDAAGTGAGARQYVGVCALRNCTRDSLAGVATALQSIAAIFPEIPAPPTQPAASVFCTGAELTWTPLQEGALAVFAIALAAVLAASLADYFKWFPEVSATQVALRGTADTAALFSQRQYSDPTGGTGGSASGGDRTPTSAPALDPYRSYHSDRGDAAGQSPPPPPAATPKSAVAYWRDYTEVPFRRRVALALIDAMSVQRNFSRWRLWDRGSPLNVFTAIRTICWMWFVASTTAQQSRRVPGYTSKYDARHPLEAIVFDSSLAVATFLYLGGYAAQDGLAESSHFGPRPLNPPTWVESLGAFFGLVVRRCGRIWPLYAAVIFLAHPVMARLGSGPFWDAFVHDSLAGDNCRNWWWTNLLFVNNVVPAAPADRCFPWAYYFALDIQLFVASPVVSLLYFRAPAMVFYVAMALLGVGSLVCLGAQDPFGPFEHQTQPQLMLIPFLGGSLLCLACREMDQQADEEFVIQDPALQAAIRASGTFAHATGGDDPRRGLLNGSHSGGKAASEAPITAFFKRHLERKAVRIAFIWCGMGLQVGTMVAQWAAHTFGDYKGARATVQVLRHPCWTVGLTAAILPMLFGYGGWVRRFFSHRFWVGASRLVFAAYLFAPLVSAAVNAMGSSPGRDAFITVLYVMWGNTWATLALGLVFHLLVERPMITLIGYDASARHRNGHGNAEAAAATNTTTITKSHCFTATTGPDPAFS